MNDPHVVSIHYKLIFGEGMRYEPPATPVTYALPGFDLSLEDDRVTLLPQSHFSGREEVRAICDPLVDAWELLIAVDLGFVDVHLKYERTEIVDRAPTPGIVEVQLEGASVAVMGSTMTAVRVVKRHVRAPDRDLRVTPDVQSLWQRFRGYRNGNEPLLGMAYFVLSVVEDLSGSKSQKRKVAGQGFNVEIGVLDKIGQLSSTRGDRLTARKLEANSLGRPLTPDEQLWLEQAVQRLILQVGRSHSGPSSYPLRMTDLPQLP